MALIGLATVSAVAIVAFVRSDRAVNKAGVSGVWLGTLAYFLEVIPA